MNLQLLQAWKILPRVVRDPYSNHAVGSSVLTMKIYQKAQ